MIQSVKYLFVVATLAILTACAAPRGVGPQFSGLVEPANDQSDVYLYRTSAFFSIGMPFEVTLDGNKARVGCAEARSASIATTPKYSPVG